MEKRLTDELEETGLPKRTQRILAIAPGCMFGFPPPNLNEMIERIDCPICQKLMNIVEQISEDLVELQQKMWNFVHPVRDRNKARQEDYKRRSRRFIIGHFVRTPKLEPEPEFKKESWYVETERRVRNMETELASLSGQDIPHWGDEENKKISREVVGAFLVRNGVYVLSI